MKKNIFIIISIIITLLVIGAVYIINHRTNQKTNKIHIYKNTGEYEIQTSSYKYEEIILDEKERAKLNEYYSKINIRNNNIQEEYFGELMVKSDDGSGFLYDSGDYGIYYDNIENRQQEKHIKLNENFVDFLYKYL